jgi:hypothetical protein
MGPYDSWFPDKKSAEGEVTWAEENVPMRINEDDLDELARASLIMVLLIHMRVYVVGPNSPTPLPTLWIHSTFPEQNPFFYIIQLYIRLKVNVVNWILPKLFDQIKMKLNSIDFTCKVS